MRRFQMICATSISCLLLIAAAPTTQAASLAKGLATRDTAPAGRAFAAQVDSETVDLFWRDLQSTDDGALLATAKTTLTDLVNDASTPCGMGAPAGCGISSIRLRVFAGIYSPAWVRTKYGTVTIHETANTSDTCENVNAPGVGDGDDAAGCQLPRFWKMSLTGDDYTDLINKLDNYIENQSATNPNFVKIKSYALCGPMTIYCEPFITQAGVNSGTAQAPDYENCQTDTLLVPGDAFTVSKMKNAIEKLDEVAATVQNNRSIVSYNQLQYCTGTNTIGNDNQYARDQMDAFVAAVGVNRAIIQVNNLRSNKYENNWCPGDGDPQQGLNVLYAHMGDHYTSDGWTIAFQTATFADGDPDAAGAQHKVGDLGDAIDCAAELGAHYVELPGDYANTGLYGDVALSSNEALNLDNRLNNN